MMKGQVFDIQRFSLHDGPGIRTTVFLKGCPLRCRWCSNPESWSQKRQISYDPETCIHCLACTEVCPSGALTPASADASEVVEASGKAPARLRVRHQRCEASGACLEVCPTGALKLYGRESSVMEVMEEVLRDSSYYEHSGGGLTLSGGEPLQQADFAEALLQSAKDHGLHTCIETCGHVAPDAFERILPLVDLFLFDYKATGEETHRGLTGQAPERILQNLDLLASKNAPIHLRCPLIPGLNDEKAHLQAIAFLAERYPAIEAVEVMPYHRLGQHKFSRLGLKEPELPDQAASREVVEGWKKQLLELGCKKLIP